MLTSKKINAFPIDINNCHDLDSSISTIHILIHIPTHIASSPTKISNKISLELVALGPQMCIVPITTLVHIYPSIL